MDFLAVYILIPLHQKLAMHTIIFLTYIHGYIPLYSLHCCVSVLLLISSTSIMSVVSPASSPNHAIAHFAWDLVFSGGSARMRPRSVPQTQAAAH